MNYGMLLNLFITLDGHPILRRMLTTCHFPSFSSQYPHLGMSISPRLLISLFIHRLRPIPSERFRECDGHSSSEKQSCWQCRKGIDGEWNTDYSLQYGMPILFVFFVPILLSIMKSSCSQVQLRRSSLTHYITHHFPLPYPQTKVKWRHAGLDNNPHSRRFSLSIAFL